jgi:hypothetical protein
MSHAGVLRESPQPEVSAATLPVGETIKVNLILPPDEEMHMVALPASATVLDGLFAAHRLDATLTVSEHFGRASEDGSELPGDFELWSLPEPRDLWISPRLIAVPTLSPVRPADLPISEAVVPVALAQSSNAYESDPIPTPSRTVVPARRPPPFVPAGRAFHPPLNYSSLVRTLQFATGADILTCRECLTANHYDFTSSLASFSSFCT